MVYKINGLEFEQKELTFKEDGILFELIKEKLPNLEMNSEKSIFQSFEQILTSGIVLPFLSIILKRKKSFKNYILGVFRKETDEEIFKNIPNSVLIKVIQDFFLLNLKWTENFTNSVQN